MNYQEEERSDNAPVEVIVRTQEMIKKLLLSFYKYTRGQKPEKLIYYRDGVSEGQFQDVLEKEITAIQRACTSV